MLQKSKNFYSSLILIIGIALLAGFLGGAWGKTYLQYLGGGEELDLMAYNNANLVISDAKKVVVNQDLKVGETFKSVQTGFIKLFKYIPANSQSAKFSYYDLNKDLASGFVISSDGWAALNIKPAELEKHGLRTDSLGSFVVLGDDKKIYNIDKLAFDKAGETNWVFIHLENASNLPVKKIIDAYDLQIGQSLLIVSGQGSAFPTFLASKKEPSGVLSSDSYEVELSLSDELSSEFANSFIFNFSGDLVAWINSRREIFAADSLILDWQRLINAGSLDQPYLGINYLDLNRIKLVDNSFNYGALIMKDQNGVAVEPGSPAAKAGLQSGDIIVRLNSQELKGELSLSRALAGYKLGDSISLLYFRDNQEREVYLKLEAKPDNE